VNNFFSTVNLARLGWQIIRLDAGFSLILGLLAALAGGSLTFLGNGPGGGYGIPDLLFLLAALAGIPGLLRAIVGMRRGERGTARWALVFIGPLLISFGYILIAHSLDPCLLGMWDLASRLGGNIPLCERFGPELNVHTRFHYLWHILPTLPIVWLYGRVLKNRLPEVAAGRRQYETGA
jgi:hypothetical protein